MALLCNFDCSNGCRQWMGVNLDFNDIGNGFYDFLDNYFDSNPIAEVKDFYFTYPKRCSFLLYILNVICTSTGWVKYLLAELNQTNMKKNPYNYKFICTEWSTSKWQNWHS